MGASNGFIGGLCLFCGEAVECGCVKDYMGVEVWICRECVLDGSMGALMASAILDNNQGTVTLEDISCCLETTQIKLYKELLIDKPESDELKETIKKRVEALTNRPAENTVLNKKQRDGEEVDEDRLLSYLDDWRSIRELQQQLRVSYNSLLEKLDRMHRKGEVDKKKIKIETGGHKYKYRYNSRQKHP